MKAFCFRSPNCDVEVDLLVVDLLGIMRRNYKEEEITSWEVRDPTHYI